ncbi:endonuclease/exonuclease/phosphatase family protein [Aureibacter tunicatorum]|uniref:Endonuclease/exonuclease/phosphatase family metal-dependent hydrolase n=1 Tax=Aureibacter tunicatorum TaxID=866807 RepID=A0AAE3XPU8_9BACT|nr:endonuclease/exonuclease/phosphatase family protein [Aureibacter tunicatorum]MDR6239134.1 endonuclease/exonuclease/phosphatase family metal-dependent hydrolase [Aureibacter tunicatorum]BDD04940.1 endonuclease [Aureibacter tunicatorum]
MKHFSKYLSGIFLILAMLSCDKPHKAENIKVTSFNIRYSEAQDGPNDWIHRQPIVSQYLQTSQADIIGFQEVLQDQMNFLVENLEGYGSYGIGRDDGKKQGEYAPIFYKQSRFKKISEGTFWLSETPEDTASVGWDAALCRIASWVKLKDKQTGDPILAINTHFDHQGEIARQKSAQLLMDKAREIVGDNPAIITGDFNLTPSEAPYKILTSETGNQFFDSYSVAESKTLGNKQTFHAYGHKEGEFFIDFIFINKHLSALDYQIDEERSGDIYISDHYPISATLEIVK